MKGIPTPLLQLDGRVAFITGGSSGIGLGIARACAAAGMKVVITYLTEAHCRDARTYFGDCSKHFLAVRADVTDRASLIRAADRAQDAFGCVHLLCNNAGIGVTTSIRRASFDDWDHALAVNLGGVINGIGIFLPRMLAHGQPAHILSTASMSGLFHGAYTGLYTTTKFAVVGLMEALRAELMTRGIGVSVLCPGMVASRIGMSGSAHSPDSQSAELLTRRRHRASTRNMASVGMDPLELGARVLEGIRRNDMYIITHPEFERGIRDRCEALLASIPPDELSIPSDRLRAEAPVLRSDVYIREKRKRMLPAQS